MYTACLPVHPKTYECICVPICEETKQKLVELFVESCISLCSTLVVYMTFILQSVVNMTGGC